MIEGMVVTKWFICQFISSHNFLSLSLENFNDFTNEIVPKSHPIFQNNGLRTQPTQKVPWNEISEAAKHVLWDVLSIFSKHHYTPHLFDNDLYEISLL